MRPSKNRDAALKNFFKALLRFFAAGRNRYLIVLALIALVALADYLLLGLIRRTFVFYSALEGATIVEDRMLRFSSSLETDIRRYVEKTLLGPVSPEAAPLFPRETRLQSLLYRDGVVYADFSESSLFPVSSPAAGVFLSFLTLNEGIRRNFAPVKDIKFFIGGKEIFLQEFNVIFAVLADNVIKTGQ